WPALGDWSRARREDEQRRRMLEDRAAAWVAHGRGKSHVLDGDELREARAWLAGDEARDLTTSDDVRRFVARSQTVVASVADAAASNRRWRRRPPATPAPVPAGL